MALGTSSRPDVRRNDIVRKALRDCHAVKLGDHVDGNQLREGIDALNAILREEDQDRTGQKRFLHALKAWHVFLDLNRTTYTTAEGLPSDVQEIHSIHWRDSRGGELPVDYISPKQWEALNGRKDLGDPCRVLLKLAQDTADNELLLWPAARTIGPSDTPAQEVIGSDTLNYQCILPHTASSDNEPITGTDWKTFWQLGGSSGSAWVDGTAYSSAASLRLLYKRPLFNFDSIDDDPDVPDGWANYLRWRLAIDLSAAFEVADTDRTWFERRLAICESKLFPSATAKTSDYHNKSLYF